MSVSRFTPDPGKGRNEKTVGSKCLYHVLPPTPGKGRNEKIYRIDMSAAKSNGRM
jgi:hypothetical protein